MPPDGLSKSAVVFMLPFGNTFLTGSLSIVIGIAVVEDNPDLCEELVFQLRHAGHDAVGFGSGPQLDRGLATRHFDVILLDVNLPGENGFSIATRMRSACPDIGIIMLTARGTINDKVLGLGNADSYLVKPVDAKELLAVIASLTRRLSATAATALTSPVVPSANVWYLRPIQRMIISPEGQRIVLTETETRLLEQLAIAFPSVAHRRKLIESLGYDYLHFDERRLEAAMSRLRRKLRSSDELSPLRSARVQGYIFGEPIRIEGT
jgi:two-component system OmpR family response regulator